jgi:hypothetical protein
MSDRDMHVQILFYLAKVLYCLQKKEEVRIFYALQKLTWTRMTCSRYYLLFLLRRITIFRE